MSTVRWPSIAIVLLVPMFLVSCTGCPPSTTKTTSAALDVAATIVDEDVHTAVWMTFNNGFVKSPGTKAICKDQNADDTMNFGLCRGTYADPETDLRPGVLFQIGTLVLDGGDEDDFEYVALTMKNGNKTTLDRNQFDWLDVNGTGRSCTLDPLHAYSMFQGQAKVVKTECDEVKLDPQSTPDTCLRARGIQAGFRPDIALITYWPGPAFYTMAMSLGGHEITYTFSLGDGVTVDRWLAGCYKEQYTDVTEIRIHPKGSSNHEGFPHQPMNGGMLIPDETP